MSLDSLESLYFQAYPRLVEALKAVLDSDLPYLEYAIPELLSEDSWSPYAGVSLACCQYYQVPQSQADQLAVTLELLHAASALHTGIHETANFRRNLEEIDSIWGNEASILLGDYLLSVAFQSLTNLGNVEVLQVVSDATAEIARGQILNLEVPASDTFKHWQEVTAYKKASLVAAAVQSSALLAGNDVSLDGLKSLGSQLGMLYYFWKERSELENQQGFEEVLQSLQQELREQLDSLPSEHIAHKLNDSLLEYF